MTADLSAASSAVSGVSGASPPTSASTWVSAAPSSLKSVSAPGLTAMLRKVQPIPKAGERSEVKFAFNPEHISVSHTYKTEGASGNSLDEQIKNLGFVEINIDKLYLTGEETMAMCETLISWSCPAPFAIGMRSNQKNSLPIQLEFIWGDSICYRVSLRQVNVNYSRFIGDTGKPIRAEVRLNLYQGVADALPSTNPTSGGPAGRSSHVLDSSECLASLAVANYGRPGAWRGIAEANAIDDPLRVRPGTLLYLPEPGGSGLPTGAAP